MLRLALTGGIGAGKSTVAAAFVACGAELIDTDVLARVVVEPGTPGLAAVAHAFGPEFITERGELDRALLGSRVFSDPGARLALNEIVHPLIQAESDRLERIVAAANPEAVLVCDIPLLHEANIAATFHATIVVETAMAQRVARLVSRGMAQADAQRRIDAQATDQERHQIADVTVRNDGSVGELRDRIGVLWQERIAPFGANLNAGIAASRPARQLPIAADRDWGRQAAMVGNRISTAVDAPGLRVDHIGSTAVPGLVARDILDFQVEVAESGLVPKVLLQLGAAGFAPVSFSGNEIQLRRNTDPGRAVDCYVRVAGTESEDARRLVALLRSDEQFRRSYGETKVSSSADVYLQNASTWRRDALDWLNSHEG